MDRISTPGSEDTSTSRYERSGQAGTGATDCRKKTGQGNRQDRQGKGKSNNTPIKAEKTCGYLCGLKRIGSCQQIEGPFSTEHTKTTAEESRYRILKKYQAHQSQSCRPQSRTEGHFVFPYNTTREQQA